MYVCNRCAARRKSRASSVVCLVCKKGELILEGVEGSAGSVGGVGGVGVGSVGVGVGDGGGGGGGGAGGGTSSTSAGPQCIRSRDRPPDALQCDHCHKLFVNPVTMPECSHKFCRSCVMDEPLPADVGKWELQVVVLEPVDRTVKVQIDPDADTGKVLKQKVVGLMPRVLQRSMSLSAFHMGASVPLSDELLLSGQQGITDGATVSVEILRREAAAGLRCPVCRSQVVPPGGDTLHGVSINKGLKEMSDEYAKLSRVYGHWE